ncbi:hypothetical protein PC116_g7539 [Phytophthora cactorum]|nr:hypothetical protein Pcac1_g5564 [Phytophthora cactorum]KAG4244617.1 hypothetical protein PC116_g7539 [Phytophthora cactorum]
MSGRVHVVKYIRHPIRERYGRDCISARSSAVVGDIDFDNFMFEAHGFPTGLAFP